MKQDRPVLCFQRREHLKRTTIKTSTKKTDLFSDLQSGRNGRGVTKISDTSIKSKSLHVKIIHQCRDYVHILNYTQQYTECNATFDARVVACSGQMFTACMRIARSNLKLQITICTIVSKTFTRALILAEIGQRRNVT